MLSHARLSILSNVVRNYSATTAESAQTAAESQTTAAESTTGAASSTTATESESDATSLLAALFPQEAKETAAMLRTKILIFSFSLLFKSVILMLFS